MIIRNPRRRKNNNKRKTKEDQIFELTIQKDGILTKVMAVRKKGIVYVDNKPYKLFKSVKGIKDTSKPPNLSQGEILIGNWLKQQRISFTREKSFRDLINPHTGMRLRMDFFIQYKSRKYCIEFDGAQHYVDCPKFHEKQGDSLERQQIRDKIKNDYCTMNRIKMIRIKYDKINLIETILSEHIN